MEIVTVALLVVIVCMLSSLLTVMARQRAAGAGSDEGALVPARSGSMPPSKPAIEARFEVTRSVGGGFRVLERSSGETILEVEPISLSNQVPSRSGTAVPANASLLAGLSGIGIDVISALRAGTEYVVRFTPKVQQMLDKGDARLMETSRGLVSDAVSRTTGQVIEHGTLVQSAGQTATQALASGLTAGAAAAQLYQIQAALERIQKRLDELVGRVRDDDHGELSAAEALVAPLVAASMNGRVPPHLAAELAVHRQRVDSIFFSRQRFVERFRDELEARQTRHAEKKDESRAWAKGAAKAFGDRETFEAEVLIYARAMSIRARLAVCTAAIVALDGQSDVADWMLREVADGTADAFSDLSRRLVALGAEDPGWTWVPMIGRKELQETAGSLAELLETQVAPQLPPRSSDVVEFTMAIEPGESPQAEN